jgi:hypothetical protein
LLHSISAKRSSDEMGKYYTIETWTNKKKAPKEANSHNLERSQNSCLIAAAINTGSKQLKTRIE